MWKSLFFAGCVLRPSLISLLYGVLFLVGQLLPRFQLNAPTPSECCVVRADWNSFMLSFCQHYDLRRLRLHGWFVIFVGATRAFLVTVLVIAVLCTLAQTAYQVTIAFVGKDLADCDATMKLLRQFGLER